MPRPRQYRDAAARQAAYRRRLAAGRHPAAASGEPGAARGATPGYPRWRGLLRQACELLTTVTTEMAAYYHERSDEWQDSARGEAFSERQENLQEALTILEEHRF